MSLDPSATIPNAAPQNDIVAIVMSEKSQKKAKKDLIKSLDEAGMFAATRLHNTIIAIGMAEVLILQLTAKFGNLDEKVMRSLVYSSPDTLKDLALKLPGFQTESDFYAWIKDNLLGWFPGPNHAKTKSKGKS